MSITFTLCYLMIFYAMNPQITYDIIVPKGETVLQGDDIALFEKLLDLLNACDDVQNIYHDAKY